MAEVVPLKKPVVRRKAGRRPLFTDTMVAWARRKRATGPPVFGLAEPMPGIVPSGHATMAQDSAVTGALNWAQGSYGFLFEEGLTFLGYPYLAELAQRPEYRRVSETIASEMTREWIEFKSTGEDKSEKLDQLADAMKRLQVQEAFRRIAEQDGFFGRAHLYIDLGTTEDRDELKTSIGNGLDVISKAKIRRNSLVALRPVEAVWAYPTDYNSTDPLASNWYRPLTWYVMGKQIHATRFLTLVGREVPDLLKPAYSFGGLSLSQMIKPYVDNWLRTRGSVGDLVHSFSTNGIKTNMGQTIAKDGEQGLFNRVDFYNTMRDNRGTLILDMETEDFFNVSTPLGGLDALQAQAQEHICSASGLPLIKFTGLTPTGLNASSEGEIRAFYDWIAAYQEQFFRKPLGRIIDFVQLSEFGSVDPEITFTFKSLWQLDEAGKATVQQTKAAIHETYETMGAVSNTEVREALISDPESPYAGLDLDPEDLPEPPAPEGMSGTQPEGQIAHEPGSTPGHAGGTSASVRSPFGGAKRDPAAGKPPTAAAKAMGDGMWAADAGWEEGKHPRGQPGNPGQFGAGGGGGQSEPAGKGTAPAGHPGHGYSAAARVNANGTIQTDDVNDAVRALYEGRKVELDQPRKVSTLVDRLGAIAKRMEQHGGKAPNFDLCNVAVANTNLFCVESMGIPRVEMPQLPDEKGPAFQKYLQDKGYQTDTTQEKASYLKATQRELVGVKVAGIMKHFRGVDPAEDPPLFISKDNYIVDGHHRWAARVGLDTESAQLGTVSVNVVRVGLPIIDLLREAETFTGGAGHKAATAKDARKAMRASDAGEWQEAKHPRGQPGNPGQFGPGGGGGVKKKSEAPSEPQAVAPRALPAFAPSAPRTRMRKITAPVGYYSDLQDHAHHVFDQNGMELYVGMYHSGTPDELALHDFHTGEKIDPETLKPPLKALWAELNDANVRAANRIERVNAGSGSLNEAEVREAATIVTSALGYSPGLVEISTEDKDFELNGKMHKTAGLAYTSGPQKGTIVLYQQHCLPSFVGGLTAHETEHQIFQAALDEYSEERGRMREDKRGGEGWRGTIMKPDGTLRDEYAADYPVYTALYPVLEHGDVWDKLEQTDGVSDYSREWWEAYQHNSADRRSALHETMAEIAKGHWETGKVEAAPVWRRLYSTVNKLYRDRGKRATSFAERAEASHDRKD
jgi:phage-related protein (TIGR01555 family)